MKIMIYHFYWECEILVDRLTSETITNISHSVDDRIDDEQKTQ